MPAGSIQIFSAFALAFLTVPSAAPAGDQIYRYNIADVDGHIFSNADRIVTVLVFTSSSEIDKARTVGDRLPDAVLGDAGFRMITVVRFEKTHGATAQKITNAVVRNRLDREAKRLRERYEANKIARDARGDVLAATDFTNAIGAQFGFAEGDTHFAVFVLGREGQLLGRWNDVPTAAELAAVLK